MYMMQLVLKYITLYENGTREIIFQILMKQSILAIFFLNFIIDLIKTDEKE